MGTTGMYWRRLLSTGHWPSPCAPSPGCPLAGTVGETLVHPAPGEAAPLLSNLGLFVDKQDLTTGSGLLYGHDASESKLLLLSS